MIPFGELLLVAAAGALIGCGTGLLPSLHVNTLAVLLLAAEPLLRTTLAAAGLDSLSSSFYVAALVLSISLAHTFINIVPATYLGAPDESTALSVLPGHKMLLRGLGFRAVLLSAVASQAAVLASLALAFPFKWLLAAPLHLFAYVREHLFWIVLTLAVLLLLSETAKLGPESWSPLRRTSAGQATAAALFLITCAYGLLLDGLAYRSLVPVPPSPLLPALSGLFGAATILTALGTPAKIPHQFLRMGAGTLRPSKAAASLAAGVVAGATMSVLPGLTNASATALATTLRKGNDEETIVSLSAVNTANAVFNLLVLYLFFRTRSGAVIAMQDLVAIEPWNDWVPLDLSLFAFVAAATGLASVGLTLLVGRFLARRIQIVPYRPLLKGVLVYMTAVVLVFTGPAGLLVFATGAAIGVIPARLGLRRVCLTGVLLGPVLSYLWPAP